MKIQGKLRMTKSSFATHPKFDSAPAEESKEVLDALETTAIAMNQTRNCSKERSTYQKRAGTSSTQGEGKKRGEKKLRALCWGCSGSYEDFRCPLITDFNTKKMQILSEWQETFDKRMSDEEFSRKVKLLREAKIVQRQLARSAEEDVESGKE
jgi:hypothetical protein